MNSSLDAPRPPARYARRSVSIQFLLGLVLALCIGSLIPNVATYFGVPRPSALAVMGVVLFVAVLGRVILVRSSGRRASSAPEPTAEVTSPDLGPETSVPGLPVIAVSLSLFMMCGGLVALGLVAMPSMASDPERVGLLPMLGMGPLAGFLSAHGGTATTLSVVVVILGLGGTFFSGSIIDRADQTGGASDE